MENWIAVGDVHGRFDLLELLLKKIDAAGWPYANGDKGDAYKLAFLGDYVDRGPDSFKVVGRIKQLCESGQAIAVLGNHEDMMLDYHRKRIFDKDSVWMMNGAHKTVRSYGGQMKLFGQARFFEALEESGHAAWLRSLPYFYETDKVWFSHAPIPSDAIIPRLHLVRYTGDFRANRFLLTWTFVEEWMAKEGTWERDHGKLAVYGHIHGLFKNVLTPRIYPQAIYADTGCGCADYAPLTAIIVEDGKYKSYIQADPKELTVESPA